MSICTFLNKKEATAFLKSYYHNEILVLVSWSFDLGRGGWGEN